MNTRTNCQRRGSAARVFSWVMAVVLVFSLVAVPASADPDTYSAELLFSAEGVDISGKIALDTTQILLGAVASMASQGVTMMDAAAYLSPQAIAVESAMIGGAYGFDLPSISENLAHSIFAPDSGSSYALDQETYDQVIAALDEAFDFVSSAPSADAHAMDTSALDQAAAVLAEVFAEPAAQLAAMLVMESSNVTEIVNGTAIDATQMRITADGEALMGAAELFVATIQESPEAQSALAVILDAMGTAGVDLGASGTEIVQMIVQQGDQLLEELRSSVQESGFSSSVLVSLSNATQNPVKLAMELQADGSVLSFNILIGEAFDFFRAEMQEDGQPGPAFQFEMGQSAETVMSFKFSIWNGTVEDASVALDLDATNQTFQLSLVSNDTTSTISGYFTMSEGLFSLTVDKMDGQEFGGTITLNLRSDDSIALPAFSEITAMSEEEFTALVQQVSGTIQMLSQMFA